MEKAKQAVSGFLHRDGKHDTTVHETVAPAITNENVTRTQHENATKVVDREVHQDHHHTSIQPIKHSEVLPEQHSHQMGQVEERSFNHGDDKHIREGLQAEKAKFQNTRTVGDVQHTQSGGKDIVGEHIHHHVHETIQPVIQKETIQPSVVHTTIPVHEVHHNEAKHHTASALPAMTMDDFKKSGGHLHGRDEVRDDFQGEPRTVGSSLGGHSHGTDNRKLSNSNEAYSTGHTTGHTTGTHGVTGTHGTHGTDATPRSEKLHDTTRTTGTHGTTGGSSVAGTGTEQRKPGLLERLNPMKDSDRDGKAGIMD